MGICFHKAKENSFDTSDWCLADDIETKKVDDVEYFLCQKFNEWVKLNPTHNDSFHIAKKYCANDDICDNLGGN